ncbi:phosphoesterase [Candidatus Endobugula sertula]|uniref:Phosphoesterase n=1 Tax=Candidatus Endobugula sertula TaxID=62101 RepID=A0A1D2QR77_9GAMM|nr:phosphoesterase [Candidatus Endobugula sertula]
MKLLILSDLHIEFANLELTLPECDIVILAGDIHVKGKGIEWALKNIPDKPVLYVLGNHEFYGKAYPKYIHEMKAMAKDTNIHILEKELVTLGNINFFGCTLWTDFELFGDPRIAGFHCQQIMNDYKKIRVSPKYSKLRSIDTAIIHKHSLHWLERELTTYKGYKNVVISHHGPSRMSLSEKKASDMTSAAYVSDLDDFILEYSPNLWIHGHLHQSYDYSIGNCRIICNPRGYPDSYNPNFNENLVVTI